MAVSIFEYGRAIFFLFCFFILLPFPLPHPPSPSRRLPDALVSPLAFAHRRRDRQRERSVDPRRWMLDTRADYRGSLPSSPYITSRASHPYLHRCSSRFSALLNVNIAKRPRIFVPRFVRVGKARLLEKKREKKCTPAWSRSCLITRSFYWGESRVAYTRKITS